MLRFHCQSLDRGLWSPTTLKISSTNVDVKEKMLKVHVMLFFSKSGFYSLMVGVVRTSCSGWMVQDSDGLWNASEA